MSAHPDPERLTLAALPTEPSDPQVTAHLGGCARCRAEVDELRRTVELARDGLGTALPAPSAHVWSAIAAELGAAGDPAGSAPTGPVPVARPSGRSNGQVGGPGPRRIDPAGAAGPAPRAAAPRRGRWRRAAAAPLAAVAGLVVGMGIGLGLGRPSIPEPPAPRPVASLAPVGGLDPAATGSVAMAAAGGERQMVVQVRGVTNTGGGDHLEAWLMDASGTRLVPLGPLDGSGGDFHGTFALPAGLPLAEFGRVDVSAERWDGNPAHSTVSVLRGDLA